MSSYSKINSSKRGQFEDQLRSLQSDIAELSSKLSIPQVIVEDKNKLNSSQVSHNTSSYADMESAPTNAKGNVARLKKENHDLQRERDEFHFRFEQASRELEDVKRVSHELGKYKAMFDNLKHDYDSLKGSLESSERIRKQQKELIQLMQRSNNIVGQVVSSNSSVASAGDMHNLSMNSMYSHVSFGGGGSVASADEHASLGLSSVHEFAAPRGLQSRTPDSSMHQSHLGIAGETQQQRRASSAPWTATKTSKAASRRAPAGVDDAEVTRRRSGVGNRQLNTSVNTSATSHNNSRLNNSYRSTAVSTSARSPAITPSAVQVAHTKKVSAIKKRRLQQEAIANLSTGAAASGLVFASTSTPTTPAPRSGGKHIHRIPTAQPQSGRTHPPAASPATPTQSNSSGKPPRPTASARGGSARPLSAPVPTPTPTRATTFGASRR